MQFTAGQREQIKKINQLKKEKNAVILVHNYQRPEIYEVADFIGDSLGLCQKAAKIDADIILFCGVLFMAESAVILNPRKKVIVPYLEAGCALSDMVNPRNLIKFKQKYPNAVTVCYVNSTAEVKANCDVCCTSSNAVKIVRSLKEKQIIFVPDKNLASYVASQVPEKEIIPWDGYCPVHHNLNKDYVKEMQKDFPKAKIIAHPECRKDVLDLADYVTSTDGMLEKAKNDDATDFLILTECGMTERLKKVCPNKNFYGLCNMCFDMKKNTLPSVLKALETEREIVKVDSGIAKKARKAFERMFELT